MSRSCESRTAAAEDGAVGATFVHPPMHLIVAGSASSVRRADTLMHTRTFTAQITLDKDEGLTRMQIYHMSSVPWQR